MKLLTLLIWYRSNWIRNERIWCSKYYMQISFWGLLIKWFGRMPLFVFNAVISMLISLTLFIWPLNLNDTSLFYATVSLLGIA
ncbi:putative potassium channel regulatory protein [Dirofilaria immitis]